MTILADNGLVKLVSGDDQHRGLELSADEQALRQRAHDLSGALAALKFIVKAVKSRYEFTPEEAETLGASADKAMALLEADAKFMLSVYTKK